MIDRHFLRLWDIYHPLLTEHQQEIADLYFNCDLSLGEIAEQKGVSRQSVSDCLKTCRHQLEEYEEKLQLCHAIDELLLERFFLKERLVRQLETLKEQLPQAKEQLDSLEEILQSDFSEEAKKAVEANRKILL